MLRLIRVIFTGDWHLHKWKHYRLENIHDRQGRVKEFHHIRECEICGTLKIFKT